MKKLLILFVFVLTTCLSYSQTQKAKTQPAKAAAQIEENYESLLNLPGVIVKRTMYYVNEYTLMSPDGKILKSYPNRVIKLNTGDKEVFFVEIKNTNYRTNTVEFSAILTVPELKELIAAFEKFEKEFTNIELNGAQDIELDYTSPSGIHLTGNKDKQYLISNRSGNMLVNDAPTAIERFNAVISKVEELSKK